MSPPPIEFELRRRTLLVGTAAAALGAGVGRSVGAQTDNATAPAGPQTTDITVTVNGTPQEMTVDNRVTLLDALREHLHLTGTKKGCDHGQCGACTCTVNGARINSCLSLAVMHDGDEVETIEGLGTPDKMEPMQAAFVEHDGFQCGYCTPGMIMRSYRFLQENPNPTEEEVRFGISGNLCRCTGYQNIVKSIMAAASKLREEAKV